MKNGNIAIDGPGSSGKSTISKLIAKKLNKRFVSTGSIYRAVAYLAGKNNINIASQDKVTAFASSLKISFDANSELVANDKVLIEELRSEEVSKNSAIVAAYPGVRKVLQGLQRSIAAEGNIVMEGRDIGSVVIPDAQFKIYLNCNYKIRAQRRFDENQAKGILGTYQEIEDAIKERDYKDKTREISPLVKVDDAIEIDSSYLTIDEVVNKIIKIVK